jgi:phosphatidylserine/phosphatidylglycerophosphate/cardiolipin synthase-like enzyme
MAAQPQIFTRARHASKTTTVIAILLLAGNSSRLFARSGNQPAAVPSQHPARHTTLTPERTNHPRALRNRQAHDSRIITAFGPDCENLLINAIQDARHEILIAIYTITSPSVTEALQKAARRGVRIHIKYDAGQIDTGRMQELIKALEKHKNIQTTPITMRGRFASMHHKFAIIDRSSVYTGSSNFTVTAATTSYENAVLILSDAIAQRYTLEFEAIESR